MLKDRACNLLGGAVNVGDRVVMTDECPRRKNGRTEFGIVTGFGVDPDLIRIRRDGVRTIDTYHRRFRKLADALD